MSELPPDFSYEASLKALKEVVDKLQRGEEGMEASMALYRQGAHLLNLCQQYLDGAELEIKQLLQGPEGLVEADFE